jgi:hypothetical protein
VEHRGVMVWRFLGREVFPGQSLIRRSRWPDAGDGRQRGPCLYMANGSYTRPYKRSSKFETTKQAELSFRVLLTEGASEVEVALV